MISASQQSNTVSKPVRMQDLTPGYIIIDDFDNDVPIPKEVIEKWYTETMPCLPSPKELYINFYLPKKTSE